MKKKDLRDERKEGELMTHFSTLFDRSRGKPEGGREEEKRGRNGERGRVGENRESSEATRKRGRQRDRERELWSIYRRLETDVKK